MCSSAPTRMIFSIAWAKKLIPVNIRAEAVGIAVIRVKEERITLWATKMRSRD